MQSSGAMAMFAVDVVAAAAVFVVEQTHKTALCLPWWFLVD